MDLCERLTMTDMRVPERRTFSQSANQRETEESKAAERPYLSVNVNRIGGRAVDFQHWLAIFSNLPNEWHRVPDVLTLLVQVVHFEESVAAPRFSAHRLLRLEILALLCQVLLVLVLFLLVDFFLCLLEDVLEVL